MLHREVELYDEMWRRIWPGTEIWQASACVDTNDNRPEYAFQPQIRWTTNRPQREGDWFQLYLGREALIDEIRFLSSGASLGNHPQTYRIRLAGIDASDDYTNWLSEDYEGPIHVVLSKPQKVAYIRVEIIEPRVPPHLSNPVWWSIQGIVIYERRLWRKWRCKIGV